MKHLRKVAGVVLALIIPACGPATGGSATELSRISAGIEETNATLSATKATLEDRLATSAVPFAMPAEYADVVVKFMEMLKEQGVLEDFFAQWSASGQNPAIGVVTEIRMFAGIGFNGVAAQVSTAVEGEGTRLPAGTIDLIRRGLADPGLSEETRDVLWNIILWNRQQIEGPSIGAGGLIQVVEPQ
jgi:hypothetical protein